MSVGLLLAPFAVIAAVTPVSPKSGEVVSLLKPEQAEFLACKESSRRDQISDRSACARLSKCGSRPAPVTLKWSDDAGGNAVYHVTLVPLGGKADAFVVSNRTSAALVNLETGRNYEWTVSRLGAGGASARGTFSTAAGPRLVFVPGIGNCRDLGGVKGLDGRSVRQGRVYRTAAYNASSRQVGGSFLDSRFVRGADRITAVGRAEMVETLGVRTDLDLRNEKECAAMDGSPLGAKVRWVHVPLRAYEWIDNDRVALVKALKVFADGKNYPVAFHCAGGRDRAGSLAYILGGILGVGEDDLLKDWELSVFDAGGNELPPQLLEGLVGVVSRYPGGNQGDRIVAFVRDCGLSEDEVAAIRKNLLEEK